MAEIRKFDQKNWVKTNLSYTRDTGSWAWILHRLSGIALIGYLFLHIYSVSPLSQGRDAFNAKMQAFSSPLYMLLEWFLFAFVVFHSLNGIRIVLVDWSDGSKNHKILYRYSIVIGIIMFFAMGYVMFSHEISNFFR